MTHYVVPLRLRQYRVARSDDAALRSRIARADSSLADRRRRAPTLGAGTAFVSLCVVAALVVGIVGAAAVFVPEAEITLHPAATRVSRSVDVTADPRYAAVQPTTAIVPARSVQVIVTGRGQTPASGYTDVPGEYASGQVVFANRTDTAVRVPKGTVVRTGSGTAERFLTTADVEVPPRLYGHARVGIVAEQPGPTGNVKELTISIVEGAVATSVDVLNDQPTSGGSLRATPVVTMDDTVRLRDDLFGQLTEEAYTQLTAQLEPGEFVPADSLDVQIMEYHYDQEPDARSEYLSMEIKVVARGIAIDSADLEELSTALLEEEAGTGLVVIPDSLSVSRSAGARGEEGGYSLYFLSISAEGMLAPDIDVDATRRALRGKSVADATQWLRDNLPLADDPEFVIAPDWWDKVPWLGGRVRVTISARTD